VLATGVSFAITRLGSDVGARARGVGADSGAGRGSAPALSVVGATADAAGALPERQLVVSATPARQLDAGHIDAGATSGSASSAVPPRADVAPTARLNGTATTLRPVDKHAANVEPETGRTVASRPAAPQKTLKVRRQEALTTGAKTGNLHLLVTPWAWCWVDGERVDQTPCMLDGLPVGRYRVRLENGVAHKDEILTATVTSGETTTIERTW
jgi:hypothetical protein